MPLPPVLTRTTEHQERMQQRRRNLSATLSSILPKQSLFTWEVGCGHGHFLTAYAQNHPEKLCVGIDIASDRIERALKKRDRSRLNNLFFIHAEGRLFLDSLPESAQASELFILFPDPWPKVRHHKHRILRTDFLSAAATKTCEGGRLCFRTDFEPYFAEAHATLNKHPQWKLADEPWPFEFETVFQSRALTYHSLIARNARLPTDT